MPHLAMNFVNFGAYFYALLILSAVSGNHRWSTQ